MSLALTPWLLFFLFLIPCLTTSGGMFFDGVTYSAIARNLADGVGSFWAPHYTDTAYPIFYEHPPLGFAFQSLIYRLLGEAVWVDTLWGILMGGATLWGISLHWKRRESHNSAWWPLFLWLAVPITSWTLKNNTLENIVTSFLIFSALFCDDALFSRSFKTRLFKSTLSGIFLILAVLTKGPVALFVLMIPLSRFLTSGRVSFRTLSEVSFGIFLGSVLSLALLLGPQWNEATHALSTYFQQQVGRSLMGMRELAPSRFYLLKRLVSELLTPLSLVLLTTWGVRGKIDFKNEQATHYLLIGLCGSLPLLLSPKQMGWYIVPSLPFYALGISFLFKDTAEKLSLKLKRPIVVGLNTVLLGTTMTLSLLNRGTILRDKPLYQDLILQEIDLPPRTRVTVCPKSFMQHWSLIAVMQRFRKISLTTEASPYLLLPVQSDCEIPPRCQSLQKAKPLEYQLLKCDVSDK